MSETIERTLGLLRGRRLSRDEIEHAVAKILTPCAVGSGVRIVVEPTDPAKRLFMGLVTMQSPDGDKTHLSFEQYLGWFGSDNEALGAWIKHATQKTPGATIAYQAVHEVTDVARAPL